MPAPDDTGQAPGAPPRKRLLLVHDPGRLDSLTACRRIAAHLGGMELVWGTDAVWRDGDRPDAALVCDVPAAAGELSDGGVPVVHLHCGHTAGALPPVTAAVRHVQAPAWPSALRPAGLRAAAAAGVSRTGLLAPARLTRDRTRAGCLLLLSAPVPAGDLRAFTDRTLRPLAEEAVRRAGRCDVVCDAGVAPVAAGLRQVAGVRLHEAHRSDVDALHAAARYFCASPTLTALSLAQARRSPLVLLPALDAGQEDLTRRIRQLAPVARAAGADPGEPALWTADDDRTFPLTGLSADDLRGAQRVARKVRQLALAPVAF
ncbi:hypothetical protein GCM10023220_35990 [Streptomyces ziwulingensis]|uniref:CGA synthase-related protein n=2 Tax=Streptomyces ziwulingensis TaxID=1045501 RepID=A0ABP9C6A9_9ACTN